MTTTTDTALVSRLREAYDAFARGDLPTVLATMSPGIHWAEPPGSVYPGPFTGTQEVVDGLFSRIPADWTLFSVTLERFLPSGNTVVTVVRYDVTHATTGRSATVHGVHVWDSDGERFTAFEGFHDTHVLRDAAGA
ncbi:nuclear transport factor 2 family protein [Pseudonocardia spirodelae]|uniref:Nuclear transport factor 2 family protein n=1 Tax=Pseudonocardia spirodelae TaxID=3133431 RepID=A0ABU8TA22_9PSEU